MSLQLGILLILASHPEGCASVPSINADMRLLSGRDFSRKLRELSRRAGPVSIFIDGLAVREERGWRITAAGRELLASLEAIAPPHAAAPALRLVSSQTVPGPSKPARPPLTVAKTA